MRKKKAKAKRKSSPLSRLRAMKPKQAAQHRVLLFYLLKKCRTIASISGEMNELAKQLESLRRQFR